MPSKNGICGGVFFDCTTWYENSTLLWRKTNNTKANPTYKKTVILSCFL